MSAVMTPTGMDIVQSVILDLAFDPSSETAQQLNNFVISQQAKKIWPDRLHTLSLPKTDSTESSFGNGGQRGASIAVITQLFDVIKKLTIEKKTDFVLVTSLLLKKHWEQVCCMLCAPAHNWIVYGVDINDQPLDQVISVYENDTAEMVERALMCVGSPDDVHILRPAVFSKEMFNAGYSTRAGGVSSLPPLASLNLMYNRRKVDSMAIIKENRRRLALKAGFDPSTIIPAKVEHGNVIRVVEEPYQDSFSKSYDGMVTNTPGVTLFAPGADCCPILLADPKTGACGAVHAGWMGTVKGAARETLKAMVRQYGTNPVDVKAAIGPSVETRCFSLPAASAKPLTDLDPNLTPPCDAEPGRVYADLVRANVLMLEQDGVRPENIDTTHALCTKCNPELFFSHQRDNIPFGNQVGFISRVGK